MSVIRCESCDSYIDTDYHVEEIIVWDPCMCMKCFERLDAFEAWKLALDTFAHELKHHAQDAKISKSYIDDVLKRLQL